MSLKALTYKYKKIYEFRTYAIKVVNYMTYYMFVISVTMFICVNNTLSNVVLYNIQTCNTVDHLYIKSNCVHISNVQ